MKKRLFALFISGVVLVSATACGQKAEPLPEETPGRVFTDSLGRTVEVPEQIDKVALSGPMAQIVLFALCPDQLVGLSTAWSAEAEAYLDMEYYNMPEIGQLYGGKGELNLETLLASGAQVVVDVGQPKDGMAEELDALQEQTGVPFVHVSAELESMDTAYRMLGELLDMETEAEELASYCASVYSRVLEIVSRVEKKRVLYIAGEKGLNVIAKDSFHSEIIDLLSDNLAVVEDPSSKGTGNEADMEQILRWDPEVILFAPDSIYDTVGEETDWQNVTAIRDGEYYEVPMGPYNWMGFPPSVQRLLGMLWMTQVLYPEEADYDLYEEVAQYYELFYHCTLTRDQYDALTANSLGERNGE